jgi:hypothetical protein
MRNIIKRPTVYGYIFWTIIVIGFFILAGFAIREKKQVEFRIKNDLFILKAND